MTQLTIFDALDDLQPVTECPSCGVTWKGPATLRQHREQVKKWPDSHGAKCENQAIHLYRLGHRIRCADAQVQFHLDLLGSILAAKHAGCPDMTIQSVITRAQKDRQ
ncbi:Uncharacterised protein [Brevibacterium casei]|uniref:C2H2-type domain-containing protein n=1 Tax=Brevibacterium casei TaxID=33889 RepID=A0A449D7L4_9MICO|nr:hypothetical protein [Brevibacterium casei]VEW13523.1 Uncharacterised protein [Brevibacterium casei]